MGLHFDIVDVFTDRAYAGNPLAVVHRARTLTARQMQAIAAEFGLSETAFTLPPTTSAATYRLRIFTPARELPFAGHPSIGAAWALAFADMIRRGDVVQECGAGLLPVHVDASGARVVSGRPEVGPDLPGAAGPVRGGRGDGRPDGAGGRGGGPREDHGARQGLLPPGRSVGRPGDRVGGGGARGVPGRSRGALRRALRADDRPGRGDGPAVGARGAGADRRRRRGGGRGAGRGADGGEGRAAGAAGRLTAIVRPEVRKVTGGAAAMGGVSASANPAPTSMRSGP